MRELTIDELALVSGGDLQDPQVEPPVDTGEITVVGRRIDSSQYLSADQLFLNSLIFDNYLFSFDAGDYAFLEGGPGGSSQDLPLGCHPTAEQMQESGEVTYRFSEVNITAGGTAGDSFGVFETADGYAGTFHTSFEGGYYGLRGVGVAYSGGISKNLATFNGHNINLIVTLGPISISDNFADFQHVGETNALSTPGFGIGVTRSDTTLITVTCPGSR